MVNQTQNFWCRTETNTIYFCANTTWAHLKFRERELKRRSWAKKWALTRSPLIFRRADPCSASVDVYLILKSSSRSALDLDRKLLQFLERLDVAIVVLIFMDGIKKECIFFVVGPNLPRFRHKNPLKSDVWMQEPCAFLVKLKNHGFKTIQSLLLVRKKTRLKNAIFLFDFRAQIGFV